MDNVYKISLEATVSITKYSKRTWWRRINKGFIKKLPPDSHGRTMLPLEDIIPYIFIELNKDEFDILIDADNGNAKSQSEIGALIAIKSMGIKFPIKYKLFDSAMYWLELAAEKGQADAMHWIGILYANSKNRGNSKDLSLMWIFRAAAHGHLIAQHQTSAILENLWRIKK